MGQTLIKQKFRLKCLVILCAWLQLNTALSFALDGNGWRELPETTRSFYIRGAIDMMYLAVEISKKPRRKHVSKFFKTFIDCVAGRPYSQIIAIVEKYMKDAPENWHYDMSLNIMTAVDRSCKK